MSHCENEWKSNIIVFDNEVTHLARVPLIMWEIIKAVELQMISNLQSSWLKMLFRVNMYRLFFKWKTMMFHAENVQYFCKKNNPKNNSDAWNFWSAVEPEEVLRCIKNPVSPSSVISVKQPDKWAVNQVNSSHMYSPVFNYLAVNLTTKVLVAAQLSSPSLSLCFNSLPHTALSLTSAYNCSTHISSIPDTWKKYVQYFYKAKYNSLF